MRLFAAIDLDEGIRESIGEMIGSLRKEGLDVKWVEPRNLHITLKFLGEVGEGDVNEVAGRVEECLKGVSSFRLSVEGAGFFGSPNHMKILWVDVKGGKENVLGIMEGMNKGLEHVKKDSHSPNVHITIGRVKSGRNRELLLRKLEEMKDVKFGEQDVKVVKLKESVLGREGPAYSDFRVFKLE